LLTSYGDVDDQKGANPHGAPAYSETDRLIHANPKRPGEGASILIGDKVEGETWTPARGIKRPDLTVSANRSRHKRAGDRGTRSLQRGATSTKMHTRRQPMFKGSREIQNTTHKVASGISKVRGWLPRATGNSRAAGAGKPDDGLLRQEVKGEEANVTQRIVEYRVTCGKDERCCSIVGVSCESCAKRSPLWDVLQAA